MSGTTMERKPGDLAKSYTPRDVEGDIRAMWEESGVFHADPHADGEAFCILIPPPNVTAALHLGHAFNNTLQDILVRYHRMRGFKTLWMPGTDHAGIATQSVVEKRLMMEGKKRTDFEREAFVAMVQEWKDEYEATITEQLKTLGASCDWRRQRFTMDEICAKAVREAFFQLFKAGLIYRGKRLVNWDPVTLTALADDEVEMKDVAGHMWYLQYPLEDGSGHVTVATTRPETMLGDTAVAVNPDDAERKQYIGRNVVLPIVGRVIPVVGDDYVVVPDANSTEAKAQYASGFLKVTPAHDPNDWEIGRRHELDVINVMAPDGSISDQHGWEDCSAEAKQFVGMSREDARAAIVDWFKDQGLLENVREYAHSVGHSYRSHVPIEPYLSDQWYVKVSDDRLVGEAQRALVDEQFEGEKPKRETGASSQEGDDDLRFYPARYSKMYEMWHANLRDWCISRQLWWGHRIPVWSGRRSEAEDLFTTTHQDKVMLTNINGQELPFIVSEADEDVVHMAVFDCGGWVEHLLEQRGFKQDPDVLDTWFSSGLWPISTMGWPSPDFFPEEIPEGNALLDAFNPSSVLCTGRDIITLWVSRMVMFNRFFREGRLPFKDVYIHPMIQDGHGQRMSKSMGNGVDPRDVVHTHGADALRFTLAQMATTTQDSRLPVDTMCPECETTFSPREITSPAGYQVAAPTQACPKCQARMMTLYGALAGVEEQDKGLPQARNSSRKFDLGRNFCNKLWNATRFALRSAESRTAETAVPPLDELSLVDRWIITRLHRTLHRVEDALADYQFNAYAEAMYDFVWREFCDWYLEAIKPTVRDSPAQQHVLRTVLNATLRLLHPVCPFVTEALWPSVRAAGPAGLEKVVLEDAEMLAAAAWPDIACSMDDKHADELFERARGLVETIRTIRGERKVPDKKQVKLMATREVEALVSSTGEVIPALAGLDSIESMGGRPGDAAVVLFEGQELYLFDLLDAADVDAERARLEKEIASFDKQIKNLEGRLGNESYVKKAPAAMVNETREHLAEAQRARAAASEALAGLGG